MTMTDPASPMVTVIIPVYNQEGYLRESIRSVIAQTFGDFEVLVVDDGSTDGSPQVAQGFGPPVRYIRKENGGTASALNVGIRAARGRWIAWLSSDDLWEPEKLERQFRFLHDRPDSVFTYTDYAIIDARGRLMRRTTHPVPTTPRRRRRHLLRGCYINGSTVLLRRDVLESVGLFDEKDRYAHDYDLWLRVTENYDAAHLDEPLVRYRVHGGQGSMKTRAVWEATYRVVARELRRERAIDGVLVILLRWWDQFRDVAGAGLVTRNWREVRDRVGIHLATVRLLVNPGGD